MSERILTGDVISIGGVFRDGTMDEHRAADALNVQWWRAATDGGTRLLPVLPSGDPDTESYWFGRENGIANEHGRIGVISHQTLAGRN